MPTFRPESYLLDSRALQLIAGRIGKGFRTSEPAFFRPILQALSDLGGSAKRSDVFNVLEHPETRA